MAMRFKVIVEDNEWESKLYKIRHGFRYDPSTPQNQVSEAVRALGPNIYHCYHDGLYIAQLTKLEDAKKACDDHKAKAEG